MNRLFTAAIVLAMAAMGALGTGCVASADPSEGGNLDTGAASLRSDVPITNAAAVSCPTGWKGEVPFCYKDSFERVSASCPDGWKGEQPFCYRDSTNTSSGSCPDGWKGEQPFCYKDSLDQTSGSCPDGWKGEQPFCYRDSLE